MRRQARTVLPPRYLASARLDALSIRRISRSKVFSAGILRIALARDDQQVALPLDIEGGRSQSIFKQILRR